MEDEILDAPDMDVSETVEGGVDYKAMYEEANAKAEKYQWYFKKEKAKQKKDPKETSEWLDPDSLRSSIMEEVEFFVSTPQAKEFKDSIKDYTSKWLSYDDAYRLVASKENPSLLIDQQTKNKSDVVDVTGVPADVWSASDFTWMTAAEAAKLPEDKFDEYWAYKKAGGN